MASKVGKRRWRGAVKQVTKSNFSETLEQIKKHIYDSDFIAVSTQRTGDFSGASSPSSHRHPWRRVLPVDTQETAYLKAKHAAERFELLQFAICPFRLRGSKSEIQSLEEEEDLKVRGFREVLDVISRSHKPIIGYNCLHDKFLADFTFIHSKFIAPLPPSMTEFMCSLRLGFSEILDINHLLKEIGPLRKANNVPAALSYLKRQFFIPVELEIPPQVDSSDKNHGHNVLRITYLFAKLNNLLKIVPYHQPALGQDTRQDTRQVEDFANIFYPCSTTLQDSDDGGIGFQADLSRKVSTDNVVLLWGLSGGISASELKHGIHSVFSGNFELQLVDRTCAIVIFNVPGSAGKLLEDMRSGNIASGSLKEMMSDGLKATGYEAYKKVCRMGLWEADLGESLEMALLEQADDLPSKYQSDVSEIYWSNELMIDLNDI